MYFAPRVFIFACMVQPGVLEDKNWTACISLSPASLKKHLVTLTECGACMANLDTSLLVFFHHQPALGFQNLLVAHILLRMVIQHTASSACQCGVVFLCA